MRRIFQAIAMPAALICALWATSAQAALYQLSASGTVDATTGPRLPITVGTPWTLNLIYDTSAPDLDFVFNRPSDPTFSIFNNTHTPPALVFFHYQAGSYSATINDPAAFGPFSKVQTTFTSDHTIDIYIINDDAFPLLAGSTVFFHANFSDFSSRPIFTSDALPTNPALGPGSFDQSTVSLSTRSGVLFAEVDGHTLTNFSVTPLPETSRFALAIPGVLGLLGLAKRRGRLTVRNGGSV